MNQSNDRSFLKIILAVLALLLLGLGYWSYITFQENQKIKDNLVQEKENIEQELKNISQEYSIEIEKGNMLSDNLIDARERITRLRDSVINLEGNVAVLSRLRKELANIRAERSQLVQKITELEESNKYLVRVNDSTIAALNQEIIKAELQEETVVKLNENVEKAATLIPTNFEPEGVIIRRSGRQIVNDRASRVDDINVCFTLPENSLATQGVNRFYLQVINPANNVMGLGKTIEFESGSLTYSKVVEFNYTGKELDICELLGADVENIEKGTYRVNLFNGAIRVGNKTIDFK
ncbi:coiled-coil domain-containing protein [Nonlabens ponticola]|uniref:Chromosome partitioning protein ParA n=1 Tax=Nonlabens ponticola TaxID=2496866 RepID=A0A3S9MVA1_9FLAO|nr:hypothetical protein [Nonlabens ponticola]AZQ43104.1 hypothetical protein EJ995_02215 [Nonlabens ponticola]